MAKTGQDLTNTNRYVYVLGSDSRVLSFNSISTDFNGSLNRALPEWIMEINWGIMRHRGDKITTASLPRRLL